MSFNNFPFSRYQPLLYGSDGTPYSKTLLLYRLLFFYRQPKLLIVYTRLVSNKTAIFGLGQNWNFWIFHLTDKKLKKGGSQKTELTSHAKSEARQSWQGRETGLDIWELETKIHKKAWSNHPVVNQFLFNLTNLWIMYQFKIVFFSLHFFGDCMYSPMS